MRTQTTPPIREAQNSEYSQRLLAAQAVLYSDVKRARTVRVALALVAAVALAVFTLLGNPGSAPVGAIGGLVVLTASVVESRREQRKVDLAVSTQEQFDTTVFQIAWNDVCVRQRPTGQEVYGAAARYVGNRTVDWYPDTSTVQRPLDVIICQQANLGWGASVHRRWLSMVVSAAGLLAVLLVAVGVACQTDPSIAMNALVIPFTPLFWESLSEALRHLDSARTKEDLQQKILALWRVALGRPVSESKVRDIQNEIVHLRRSNAQVPDWFDNRLRDDNEKAMRVSAADMVAEAARHGKA